MCEGLCVACIPENIPLRPVANEFGDTRENRSNHRQAAGHRFRDGKTERILQAGADINIRNSVEIENIATRRLPAAPLHYSKLFCSFIERFGLITSGDDELQGQLREGGYGFEDGGQSFHAPIIADQEKHKIVIAKTPASSSFRAASEPRGGRELLRVHTIGNNADVLSLEVLREKPRRTLRNCCKRDSRIRVNAVFQPREQLIVKTAMQPPKNPRFHRRDFRSLPRKFPKTVKQRVDDHYVGAKAIDPRR